MIDNRRLIGANLGSDALKVKSMLVTNDVFGPKQRVWSKRSVLVQKECFGPKQRVWSKSRNFSKILSRFLQNSEFPKFKVLIRFR